MKTIKTLITFGILTLLFFFACHRSSQIDIEGNWSAKKIVFNGKQIYPSKMDNYFDVNREIVISNWSDEMYIPFIKDGVTAHFTIETNSLGKSQVKLTSNEKALNGNFAVAIDTLHLGPLAYRISVTLQSKKTLLYFQREVQRKPWKPEFPRKGQV